MAPSLIETSYTSTYYPVTKEAKPLLVKPHVEGISVLQAKYEKLLGIEVTTTEITATSTSPAVVNDWSRAKHEPRANADHLWQDNHYTTEWDAIPRTTCVERQALSEANKSTRDWFVMEAKILGCEIKIDAIGNIFAVLPGENMELAPIGMGSNFNTQPAGGPYDGILGVLVGLEVLRSIRDAGIKTYAPVAAIIWTNVEGPEFNPGCLGSAVWSGQSSLSAAHKLRDERGTTLISELSRIKYLGRCYADYHLNPLSAYLELHIEQDSRPEQQSRKTKIVTGIQRMRWYKVNVSGVRAYTGSTPMANRTDALVATSSIITFLTEEAIKRSALATVGVLQLDRPVSSAVSGSVAFTIDVRCQSEEGLNDIEEILQDKMALMIVQCPKLMFRMTKLWEAPAVELDSTLTSCIQSAAIDEVGDENCLEIQSFVGHDSVMTSSCGVPTAMIFVPSDGRMNHVVDELASKEDCGHGIQILLNAVLKYDSLVKEYVQFQEHTEQLNRELMKFWESWG
ncbi:hypothetical protein B0O99DRAFT_373830 [Bisporella sp. PMI_857]|nr:hypothetical protein B0O99DRAFT_373830 [Bisporella sp. PMI_857]